MLKLTMLPESESKMSMFVDTIGQIEKNAWMKLQLLYPKRSSCQNIKVLSVPKERHVGFEVNACQESQQIKFVTEQKNI